MRQCAALQGTLCKLWDRGELDRVRVADGATKLHGRRFAMNLMAQPVIAERALADDVLAGQGFLARCLLAWPESTAGTRHYVVECLRDDPDMERLVGRLGDLHRMPLPLAEGERQELAPRCLYLSANTKSAWVRLANAIEAGMAPGGKSATVKPWASKAPEQALRIAGVLTLVAAPEATMIDADTLARAADLAVWHLGEAVRLVGMAEVSGPVRGLPRRCWRGAMRQTGVSCTPAPRCDSARLVSESALRSCPHSIRWDRPLAGRCPWRAARVSTAPTGAMCGGSCWQARAIYELRPNRSAVR